MKTLALMCSFTFLYCFSFAQPQFGYSYTNNPGGNIYADFPLIEKCPDGSIIGTSSGNSPYNFMLFKMDINGNMLWKKQIMHPTYGNFYTNDITLLADSTLAILLSYTNTPNAGFSILKFDLSGNLLWAKKYYNFPNSTFEIASYGLHGMMVAKQNRIAYINGDGTIFKSWELINQNISQILAMQDMGNGITKLFGIGPGWDNIFLLDLDTLGNIQNQYEFNTPNDTVNIPIINPSELICKGPAGSVYCTMSLNSSAVGKSGVYMFDAQNQPVWSKKMDVKNARNIKTTSDSGCIVTANYYNGPDKALFVAQFDTTGTISWEKFPGDLNPQNPYNYGQIKSIARDNNAGWYCSMERPNFQLFHTDAAFSGICFYQNLEVLALDLMLVSTPTTETTAMVMMTDSTIDSISVNNFPWYRYDSCTGIIVDSSLSTGESPNIQNLEFFPNPADKNITVVIPGNISGGELTIFNSLGESVAVQQFSRESNINVDLHNLKTGIYFLQLKNEKIVYSGKVLKTD